MEDSELKGRFFKRPVQKSPQERLAALKPQAFHNSVVTEERQRLQQEARMLVEDDKKKAA